jgi:hypothetical protein
LIEQDYAWFYKPNLGEGRFGPMQRVARRPSIAARGGDSTIFDLAGDGQLDLVQLERSSAGFYERRDFGRIGRRFRPCVTANLAWDDPNLRFVDLTGDGHADILITEDEAFTWYPSRRGGLR